MFVSYAQNFEDVLLWRALRHVDKGFYIDIGAQDPVIDSVSLAFHRAGWRGIHVEPSAQYAELLRQQRPGDVVVQAAVSASPSVARFFEIAGSGISTLDPAIAEQHRGRGFDAQEKWVPTISLESLFAGCDVPEIHWLKIDVEGSELSAISSWGSAPQRPWLVVVESTLPLCQVESSAAWEFLLVDRGYQFAYFDGLNRYYVSQQRAALLSAFKTPPNVFDAFALSGTSSSPFHQHMLAAHAQQVADLRNAIEQQGQEQVARIAAIEAQAADLASVGAAKLAAAQATAAEEIASLKRNYEEREARLANQASQQDLHVQQLLGRIEAINAERLSEARALAELERRHTSALHEIEVDAAQRIARAQEQFTETIRQATDSYSRNLEGVVAALDARTQLAHRLAQDLEESRSTVAVLRQKPLNRLLSLLARKRPRIAQGNSSSALNEPTATASSEATAALPLTDSTAMQKDVLAELLLLNDVDFVSAAYREILKRPPDPSGELNYLTRLKQGHDRVRMLGDMAKSEEGRRVKAIVPGLDRALRWNTIGRLPVLGSIMVRLGSFLRRDQGA